MIINRKQKETLVKYSSVLRVPHSMVVPVIQEFITLCEKSGLEWTIGRFKAHKLDLVRLRAGLQSNGQWVARRADGTARGPVGGLQRWGLKCDRNFDHAIQLLQMYSAFIAEDVLQSQSKKFVDALVFENEAITSNYFDHYNNLLMHSCTCLFPLKRSFLDPDMLSKYPTSTTRSEPHASGASIDEGLNTLECARSFLEGTEFGRQAVLKYPQLFGPLLEGIACHTQRDYFKEEDLPTSWYEDEPWEQIEDYNFSQNIVGKIGLIQEPGLKLRAVANPARVYQAALKPLGDALYGMLLTLPWDCTHDQAKPFVILQKHLKQGKQCYAVDLSNATDRFPLEFQYRVLQRLFLRLDAVDLFHDLAKANWGTSLTDEGIISWKCGQPLGLYPSFAIFALVHGLMLYALNGFSHDNQFYVLGDDVVILNDQLYNKYIRFLSNMNLPFAANKTISSNLLTEFGGKLILENRVVPQLKWRHVSDDSFLDLATHFGERFRYLMLPRQKAIFDLVKVLPVELGGCGLNPTGIPLSQRISFYNEVIVSDTFQSYMLSYNRRLNALNYEPFLERNLSVNLALDSGRWFYPSNITHAFDQKALALLNEKLSRGLQKIAGRKHIDGKRSLVCVHMTHPYGNETFVWETKYQIDHIPQVIEQLLGNQLFRVSPRERGMPIEGGGVRKTTLQVLEQKLRFYR